MCAFLVLNLLFNFICFKKYLNAKLADFQLMMHVTTLPIG